MNFLDWEPANMSMYAEQGRTDAETASEIVKTGNRWVLLFRGSQQPDAKVWMINNKFDNKDDLAALLQIAATYISRHGIKLDEKI